MVFGWSLSTNILTVLIATVLITILWFKKRFSHWRTFNVPYVEPWIPFGNAAENIFQKLSFGDWTEKYYHMMRARKVSHAGVFLFYIPIYIPIDLDLVKCFMQTDFVHFTDHGGYLNERDDPLTAHLFSLSGQKWRNLRVKLSPVFTSGKMKMMFPIMVKISNELKGTLSREISSEPIDIKDIAARFTTDVIGNCAFGIDCNSLKDPETEFRVKGKRIFNLTAYETTVLLFCVVFPNIMKALRFTITPKESTDFFWNAIRDTTDYRIKSGVRRNDALQLLIDMLSKDGEQKEDTLTFAEMAAQAFVFFIAGFETSSTLMSFALLELGLNQDVQDKLREEIVTVMKAYDGELTYDSLHEMRYMDMVINETLRKYPPLPVLTRECTKEYRVPDTEVIIRKGDAVFIPIKGIHYDPEYYPDPEKFDPTRFSEENKSKRHQFAFLPFGEGPRICIGLRFGLMQAKVGLSTLIKDFKFKLNPRTELPVKLDPKNFLTSALGGLWMDVEKIN